tara:strand:- start:682 stop:1029 length:348 start_codon:yes stop_codon:yes gene_type:complete
MLKLNKKDLKIERIKSTGKGGQNVNKRDTAIRITHLPSGIVAKSSKFRTQHQNQKAAMERLIEKIEDSLKVQKERYRGNDRVIRHYNKPRNRVKDVRTGNIKPYQDVLDGDIDFD